MEYVDVHTHHRRRGLEVVDISDGKIAEKGELCSMGIHPMFIGEGMGIEEIREEASKNRIVAIGEAGFDRNSGISIEEQKRLFEEEVKIAEEYRLPMIIHCVRAFPELLSVYKSLQPRQAWIIHGYNNNEEILRQLIGHGFYISAGKKLFLPESNIRRVLPLIPLEQLFLETDDSDWGIEAVYRTAAELRKISLDLFVKQVYGNFEKAFHYGLQQQKRFQKS